MITILYFARLREELGLSSEHLELPGSTATVADLLQLLRSRDANWQTALSSNFRLAVNQQMANLDTRLQAGDEVALFPPVTGG